MAVDEEGRRAGHPEADPLVYVLLPRGLGRPAREAALEAREVQPHLRGVRLELLRTGLGRIGEEDVVILPEFPLVVGAPRPLGCLSGLGMEAINREVPED